MIALHSLASQHFQSLNLCGKGLMLSKGHVMETKKFELNWVDAIFESNKYHV